MKIIFVKAVAGGPTHNEHNFLQFHMHWGDTSERGSEHLIDGKAFSAELHFVNWNHDIYKSPKHATISDKNDGLLVLGVLIKVLYTCRKTGFKLKKTRGYGCKYNLENLPRASSF